MKKFLILTGLILFLAGCNENQSAINDNISSESEIAQNIPTDQNSNLESNESEPIASQPPEDLDITVNDQEAATTDGISLEFDQGLLYLESKSIFDEGGDYIGDDQYFIVFDLDTKQKEIFGPLEGENTNPKLATVDGENRIFVQRSEGNQLAADLGYYSLPSMTYTPLSIPHPGTTWQHGVNDYLIADGIIYYLQGCRGIFCNIGQFDLSTAEHTMLAKDIDSENINTLVIDLGDKISEKGELYLFDSFGHAGSAHVKVYTFSLEDASIELLEHETTLYFCDNDSFDKGVREEYGFTGEECTEEQLERNRDYDAVMEKYLQVTPGKCDDYDVEYSNEQREHLLSLEGEEIALGNWVQLIECH